MSERPTKYVVEDHAHRASRLEARRDQLPGSFILWEEEGVELPSGRRTGPTYVLWRPVTRTAPDPVASPEPPVQPAAPEMITVPDVPALATPAADQSAAPTTSANDTPASSDAPAADDAEPTRMPPTRNKRTRVSPRHLPKTTRHKGITRIDYPPKRTFGYMARVPWQGKMHQKFFSDKKHGDRLGALAAALEWRDKTERDLGKPRSEEPVAAAAPTSNTGVLGVSRVMSGGKAKMQVTWTENGRVRRTSFSIDRHGERGALKLARAVRVAADKRKRQQALGGDVPAAESTDKTT